MPQKLKGTSRIAKTTRSKFLMNELDGSFDDQYEKSFEFEENDKY